MNFSRILALSILATVVAGTGCVVYVDGPPRRYYAVEGPRPAADVVISEDDEVHYVVYREYFGWGDDVIGVFPYYRRYYGLTYDDFYFLGFVGCRCGITFDACFRSYYYSCGRSYDQLVIAYNVPRSSFFCSVNVGVATYPAVYQRTYVAYQQNTLASVSIQNREYAALVQMKVGVDYQGHTPNTFIAQVNAHGGDPGKAVVANRDACGKGGVTATGARVNVTAQRPWTMPPAQKQAWHNQQIASAQRQSQGFNNAHRDQVQKVQAQQRGNKPADNPHARSGENPHTGQPDQGHSQGKPPPPSRPVQPGTEHSQGKPPPKGEHEEKK